MNPTYTEDQLIIRIDRTGKVTVDDQENFRAFSMLIMAQPEDLDRIAAIVEPAIKLDGQGNAWIEADAVTAWANRANDAAWRGSFDRMVDFARQHGWIQDEPLRIRAHVKTIAA